MMTKPGSWWFLELPPAKDAKTAVQVSIMADGKQNLQESNANPIKGQRRRTCSFLGLGRTCSGLGRVRLFKLGHWIQIGP
jgi:hypothetical protein